MGKISILDKKKHKIISLFFFLFFLNYIYSVNSFNNSYNIDKILKRASDIGIKNIKKSLELTHRALKLSINSDDKKNQYRSLKILINIYKEIQDYKTGLKYVIKLYEIEKEYGKVETDTLIDLGEFYSSLNSLSLSLNYYKKALEEIEKKNDFQVKAEVLIKIGTVFGQLGNYKNELKYYLKANKLLINTKK